MRLEVIKCLRKVDVTQITEPLMAMKLWNLSKKMNMT
jgi:hypothetical protein